MIPSGLSFIVPTEGGADVSDLDGVVELIVSRFSLSPRPDRCLRESEQDGDIGQELAFRFEGKPWSSVTLEDWIMTATVPAIREFLFPEAFFYYAPSLLIGAVRDMNYIDWGLDALSPPGRKALPRGEWWPAYYRCFNADQKAAVRSYLSFVQASCGRDSEEHDRARALLSDVWC